MTELNQQSAKDFLTEELSTNLQAFRVGFPVPAFDEEIRELLSLELEEDPDSAIEIMETLRTYQRLPEMYARLQRHVQKLSPLELNLRAPLPGEPSKIHPERITVLCGRPKVLIDLGTDSPSEEMLYKLYHQYCQEHSPEQATKIFESYHEQMSAFEELSAALPKARFVYFFDLNEKERQEILSERDTELFIGFGGDDTSKSITPGVKNKYFLAFNSDRKHSVGANATHTSEQYAQIAEALVEGHYRIEEWTRIECEIEYPQPNGSVKRVTLPPAINEVAIADQKFNLMTRGSLRRGDKVIPVKSSGILISTPAGKLGWNGSANSYFSYRWKQIDRSLRSLEVKTREPYLYGKSIEELKEIYVHSEEPLFFMDDDSPELSYTSSSNNGEVVSIDCARDKEFPLPRGATVHIRMAEKGLMFVRPEA